MILENMVFKYVDTKDERIRIIHIDSEKQLLYYVNIDSEKAIPKSDFINKIEDEIETKILISIRDPYLMSVDEEKLSDVEKEKRDKNWEIISKVWEENKVEFLDEKKRGKILKHMAEEEGINISTFRRMLSRFLQRGMTRNALLPDYKNSGGKGKEKKLQGSKIGRPKTVSYYDERLAGINITDDIKVQFEIAVKKYYRKPQKLALKETYNYILRDYFSDQIRENGEIKYKVWDKSRIPTYDQFYYWFKKNEDTKKDMILRESAKNFELEKRQILSNSTIETDGPGTRYQIDATIADIYLVSELDINRIIGRPVVYAIIDVFSRLVTGVYVGLEGPSWLGAMMALDNMVCDKVEFCKEYDIDITEEQWPAKHLPEIIITDGGEGKSKSAKGLINNLNIKFETTSSYRGDLKGIVERRFRTINTVIKHKSPGAIQKEYRERGDKDYRLDATLTLREFTEILIKLVLYHNTKTIDEYPATIEMVNDNITPKPISLWNWGIENRKGRLRVVDREIFRLNVLPRGKANVSRAGIKFKGLFYGSQKALDEQWFITDKIKSIEIVYDPRNMNNIYIPNEAGNRFETCYLLEKSKQYKDCILEEIQFNLELLAELKELEKDEQIQKVIDIDNDIDNIIKKAKKEKENSTNGIQSKNKRLKNIRNNRAVEKEINREKEAFKLGEVTEENNKMAEVIELPRHKEPQKKDEDAGKARLMDKLRKKRDQNRGE